jgi:transposase
VEIKEETMDVVGIDIAKRKFDVAWLSGEKVRNKVFDNTPGGHQALLAWLHKQGLAAGSCHVAMEATSQYYEAVALALHDAGYTVSVVNPLQIKAFQPLAWQPPAAEIRELQRLLARLEAVQEMHVQEQNRRHEAQGASLDSVERMAEALQEEARRLERMIREHIDRHPGLRDQQELLRSIPGIGERTSSYVLAWLQAERFADARQAVAFIGLSPRHRESGESLRGRARLSKLGHGRLRKMLYLPAMSAIRSNPAAQALSQRLKAGGKRGKLIIVAVMRKLVHWMMGVLKAGAPFDAKLALAKG